jgi:hypothetical protein
MSKEEIYKFAASQQKLSKEEANAKGEEGEPKPVVKEENKADLSWEDDNRLVDTVKISGI